MLRRRVRRSSYVSGMMRLLLPEADSQAACLLGVVFWGPKAHWAMMMTYEAAQ